MSKCITAFTEVDYPEEAYYPGYVSINAEEGRVEIAVRETGSDNIVMVDVPLKEYCRMIRESLDYLHNNGLHN